MHGGAGCVLDAGAIDAVVEPMHKRALLKTPFARAGSLPRGRAENVIAELERWGVVRVEKEASGRVTRQLLTLTPRGKELAMDLLPAYDLLGEIVTQARTDERS